MLTFFNNTTTKALFILSSSLTLVSCSTTNDTDAEPNESETNTEISFMIPDWGAPTEEMLADFENETNIQVNVIPTAWDDIRDNLSIAAASNEVAADVFEVDWSWVGEFTEAGWLAPIEIEDESAFPAIDSFKVEDTVYAVPYANDFRIAYYNEVMYNQVGIDEAPSTWDQVISNSVELKESDVVEYPISLPLGAEENATTTFLWLTYTRNGVVFNDDNTLNKKATLDSLQTIEELVEKDLINPANTHSSGMDAYNQIATGDTAFMVGPSSFVSRVNDEEESTVIGQVIPSMLPGKEDFATTTVPYNEAIGISSNTDNMEAAQEFVKWYTSPETQIELFHSLNVIPTRIEVLEHLIEENAIENSGAMVELAKITESPFPNGVPNNYTEISTEIFNTINRMANGQLSAEEATDYLVTSVNELVLES